MKKILFLTALLSAAAAAQEVNTTVHITNSYQAWAGEVSRTGLQMRVPDSLSRFDYKFEYSVFDTPYRSIYEFRPFAVNVTPDTSSVTDKSFWMKAGAGYPLRPELRAVWTPVRKDRFRFNLRQDFRGYYGNYRTVRKTLGSSPLMTTVGARHDGYDFYENFGGDLDWRFKRSTLKLGLDYDGIFTRDEFLLSNYNGGRMNLAFATAEDAGFGFAIKVDAGLSVDKWPEFKKFIDDPAFGERFLGAEGYLAPTVSKAFKLKIGYDFKYVDYTPNGESYPCSYYIADLSPQLRFNKGVMTLCVGANLGYAGAGLKASPLLDLSVSLFKQRMELYAKSEGGFRTNSVSSLKRANHWYSVMYNPGEMKPTYETMDARAGLRGCISQRLQYDISAGYAVSSDMALYTFSVTDKTLSPALGFEDYKVFSANALLAWRSERVDADGRLCYRRTSLKGLSSFIDAPMFSGDARVTYNYRRRIFAGVALEASTERRLVISGESMSIPQWLDLSLNGEYRFTRKFSLWLKLSNLLNQPIQRLPMHVEQGIGAVAGICLDFE